MSTKSSLDLNFRFYLTKLPHLQIWLLMIPKQSLKQIKTDLLRESLGKWEHEVLVKSRYKIKIDKLNCS